MSRMSTSLATNLYEPVLCIGFIAVCPFGGECLHNVYIHLKDGRLVECTANGHDIAKLYLRNHLTVPQHFMRFLTTDEQKRRALGVNKSGVHLKRRPRKRVSALFCARPDTYPNVDRYASEQMAKAAWDASHTLFYN